MKRLRNAVLCLALLSILPAALAGPKGPRPDQELGVLAHQDLAAVQQPLYPTRNTLEVGLVLATLPNDPYVLGLAAGVSGTYHLSERLGAELLVAYGDGWDTHESLELQQLGIRVDAYAPRLIVSANAQWTPIYAKLNLLGRRVVHFDVSLSGGPGLFLAERTLYNDTEASRDASRYNFPLAVDLGLNQRFFFRLGRYTAAVRLDARDYLYRLETVEGSSWLKHNWMISTGLSCFFGLGQTGGGHGK